MYEKIDFKTGEVLTADALNHMQEGIAQAMEAGGGITPTTWAELKALRDAGALKAGTFYRITDYVTTTIQENTKSAGHLFDVIVLALSENTLAEEAYACKSEFDIEKYKDAYSQTWGEKMLYIGTQEYEGKECHLYESESHDLQMLVDFSHPLKTSWSIDESYPFIYFPSYTREFDGSDWGMWEDGMGYSEVIQFKYEDPSYFDSCKLEAWQIRYSLDNDTERFAWADAENGKGVIYRMIDEWNNDCPYDFKNIMFERGINLEGGGIEEEGDGDGKVFCYTFSWEELAAVVIDASIYGNNGFLLNDEQRIAGVCCNTIKPYIGHNAYAAGVNKTRYYLNNIVFLSTYEYEDRLYYGCYSNNFGNDCHSISANSECNNNNFGNDCHDVKLANRTRNIQVGVNTNAKVVIKNLFD